MAISSMRLKCTITIPLDIIGFDDNDEVYCYKEDNTGRLFLSTSKYDDGEMFCKVLKYDRRVVLSEDAIKYLFRKGRTKKVSITARTSDQEKKLYIEPFE